MSRYLFSFLLLTTRLFSQLGTETTYKAASTEEVADFIKKNKHLPEIPSAIEMKNAGIDLTEMNLRLLKKVEELTLWSIEQDKRIRQLEQNTPTNK